ncbi:MAG: stage II sporulation protein M [Clostridiales bacterium]|nr:stage II sporulation protein M [Clostridiales bacterium]
MKKIRRRHRYKKEGKVKKILLAHIENNLKDYTIIAILFIIGIICGVFFINNINENQYTEIEQYINNSIEILRNEGEANLVPNLFKSLKNNMIFIVLLWLFGMIIIGSIFIYTTVAAKGFLLGYTIAAFITVLGIGKGSLYSLSSLLLQNIILIPCLFITAVSSKTVYKSIINTREKGMVKGQIIRHTLLTGIISVFVITSSMLEIYISRQLFIFSINWF